MNTVEPIRDIKLIRNIAQHLKSKSYRNYMMFLLGIYTGLRITDILNLRVSDVKNTEYIYIHEQKTGKEKRFLMHPDLRKELNEYLVDKKDSEYLIKSRHGRNKPITRAMAYSILKEVAQEFNIESLGTHSMRKTFGYFLYKQTNDIVILKEIFNHSDLGTTLRYIGLIQDSKDSAIKKLKFI